MKNRKWFLKMGHVALLLMFFLLVMGSIHSITVYADPPAQIEGEWIQSSNGRWWYRHTDGSYTSDGWEYINGYWYHFDSDGWMQTGWLQVNSTWYYLSSSGAMVTGWENINSDWYYFSSSGAMCTGWQYIGSGWYYFNPSGDMRLDDLFIAPRYYTFFPSGRLRATLIWIDRERQLQTHWCWAACAVMVGTYHSGVPISQNLVVYYVKGIEGNYPGTIPDTIWALYYASDNEIYGTSTTINNFPYSTAASKIDSNHLFIMRIEKDSGGAHMVVGAGYDHNDNSIFVIDPWKNSQNDLYPYDDLRNGTTIKSGAGRWTHTIYY